MTNTVNEILNQALELNAIERADIAENLLFSLDKPDPKIDEIWATESDARIQAFNNGEIEAVSQEQVFAKYRK